MQKGTVWLLTLAILGVTAILGYTAYRGFNEAAGNRHKVENIYRMCLADHQPALTCKVAANSK